MHNLNQYFIALVIVLVSSQVNATLITLDGNNIRDTGMHIEENFKISAPVDLVNGGNLGERSHLNAVGFSGDYMETWNTDAVFTLEEISGKTFDLISLNVGSFHTTNKALAAWTFTGFNGKTEVFSLINSEYLGRLLLNWIGLTHFTIASSRGSAASAFDNIEVFVPSVISLTPSLGPVKTVEAPQSVWLIALSLLYLGFRRYSRFTRIINH